MEPGTHSWRRRPSFWLIVAAATTMLSVEPALSLVLLAFGLSALALVWTVLLARLWLLEVFGMTPNNVRCPVLKRDVPAPR